MWQSELKASYGLSKAQIKKFERFLEILSTEYDRNLTAVTERGKIVDIHFHDSLSLIGFPELESAKKAVDVGSGAGIPGIPLAIVKPELKVLLLESTGKKCLFMQQVATELELANVEVECRRAEEAGRSNLRESFDIACARAVGSIPVTLEYSIPLLKVGGFALLQRGKCMPDDFEIASMVSEMLGAELDRVEKVKPYSGAKNLHVWVFQKVAHTNERFPRKAGTPKKRPLG